MNAGYVITAGVVAAAVLAAALYQARRRHRAKSRGGFEDWVSDPSYRRAVEAEWERQDKLEPPPDIDRAGIDALVEQLLAAEHTDADVLLAKLGAKAVPSLLAALRDERFWDLGTHVLSDPPAVGLLALLEPFAPPESIPPLVARVRAPGKTVRQTVALALGANGGDTAAGPLKIVLDDEDDYVRSYAMIGIGRALDAGRATEAYKSAAFDALVPLLDRVDESVSGDPPRLLLRIDRERAEPVLLSDRFLRTENVNLHYILRALNAARVPVPLERLKPVMEAAKARLDDARTYPHEYVYGESLRALARAAGAAVEPTLREALGSPNADVAESAAEAIALLRGVEGAHGYVFERIQAIGYAGLTGAQRAYYCVSVLRGEVNNGGFLQYFVNSSGDGAGDAAEALRVVGATEAHDIFTRALAVFGRAGPAADRDARHEQVSKIAAKAAKVLAPLESRFYEDKDRLLVKLQLFAAAHPEDFGGRSG